MGVFTVKHKREFIIFLVQLFMFYIFPLFGKYIGSIMMVLVLLSSTFILSILFGMLSNSKIKYMYPIVISVIFIPSIWIYYNESALVHSIWYFVISIMGTLLGSIKIRR